MNKIVLIRYLTLFTVGISLCFPNFVDAFSKHNSTCPFKKKIFSRLFDLSDEQIEELEELKAATRSGVEPLVEEIKELGSTIPETLLAEEVDVDGAATQLQEVVNYQCEISTITSNAGLEGFQIVTSEKRLLSSEQRKALVVIAENALDLIQYISDYPGWDKIKDDFEQYLEPIIDDCHPDNISRKPSLDLTDEQIAALEQLGEDTKAAVEPLEDEMMVAGFELFAILMEDDPVIADAEEKLAAILDLDCQVSSLTAGAVLEGVQILTAEQRQTILEEIEDRQNHRNRWNHWRKQ
jgi:Spy/CpxP family protein refolding chaperone